MTSALQIKDKTLPTEGFKIAEFKTNIRKTTPHKHNSYFEIIFLTQGSGKHTIDAVEYKIVPPVIHTVRKEQIHFWDLHAEPKGYVIIIKKHFIDQCRDEELKKLIADLSSHKCNSKIDGSLEGLYQQLLQEHQSTSLRKRTIVEGYLKIIFAKILESIPHKDQTFRNNNSFEHYLHLLSQVDRLSNNVAQYAELLHTTPQNLNAICQKEVGQSASTILSEHIISEAKRMLFYTTLTVSEISTRLDFKDNSHFTKYFKKHVGQTPLQCRNMDA